MIRYRYMVERTTDDRVAECVHVLRGVGVSEETIAEVHDLSGTGSVVENLAETVAEPNDRRLYDCLHETIVRSDRGLELRRDHDLDAAAAALAGALEPYDCSQSVAVEDGSIAVEVTDAAGDTRSTTMDVPTATDDPLPVLAHAVGDLLSGTGLAVVLLTEREDVWRLALVQEPRLTDLQKRLGLRLTVFGRPLLCADQPGSFVRGTATAYATATDGGVESVRGGDSAAVATETTDSAALSVDAEAFDRLEADLSAAFDSRSPEETDDGPEATRDVVGGGPDRVVGEGVDDIVRSVTDEETGPEEREFASVETTDDRDDGDLVGTPDRIVVDDESVDSVLAEVGVVELDSEDVDLDDALASMAGEFDAAPPLPEPLAAATGSTD